MRSYTLRLAARNAVLLKTTENADQSLRTNQPFRYMSQTNKDYLINYSLPSTLILSAQVQSFPKSRRTNNSSKSEFIKDFSRIVSDHFGAR